MKRTRGKLIALSRTFALLKYWLERDMLEAVFMDYRLQAALYLYAREKGATAGRPVS